MREEERFHHHPLLETVAAEDVRFLLERDRQYGASWKESGGRSAWFMLRRKIDRLVQIARKPDDPEHWKEQRTWDEFARGNASPRHVQHLARCYNAENIFALIHSRPGGEDGSALAEIRDLRRYLLLVEAEMMARGVVARPDAPTRAEPLVPRHPSTDFVEWPPSGGGANFDGSVSSEPRPVSLLSATTDRQPVPRFSSATRRARVDDGCSSADRLPGVPYLELRDRRHADLAYYVADRKAMTEDEVEHLPRLQIELNNREYEEERPWYQPMYEWHEAETKWRLKSQYRESWGRQP